MTFKIVQLDNKPTVFQQSVQLDLTRATAILYRQSKRGSDKTHIESRKRTAHREMLWSDRIKPKLYSV